jgi:hypothetical protein
MFKLPILLLHLISVWSFSAPAPAELIVENVVPAESTASSLFIECGLLGELTEDVFLAGYDRVAKHDQDATILAIADMTQPSTAKRLYLVDLRQRKLLMRTHVAHGQKTGELMATSFSNENGSHKTSLGLYQVGERITSPKHGPALLLHGLDLGLNDQALAREVIMHGADYVSEEFIKANGRLGRSWGCPAVSRADMPRMIDLLSGGALLYIHG